MQYFLYCVVGTEPTISLRYTWTGFDELDNWIHPCRTIHNKICNNFITENSLKFQSIQSPATRQKWYDIMHKRTVIILILKDGFKNLEAKKPEVPGRHTTLQCMQEDLRSENPHLYSWDRKIRATYTLGKYWSEDGFFKLNWSLILCVWVNARNQMNVRLIL